MRKLIIVPLIHSEVDLGSARDALAKTYQEHYGKEKWKQHQQVVNAIWQGIRQRIGALKLNFTSVKLYQDGLPVCHKEENIVRDLAAQCSANHQLLMTLMEKGARLMGTESPELLLKEYELVQKQIRAIEQQRANVPQKAPLSGTESNTNNPSILEQRDRFIARRIDNTLGKGETGILFIGLLHQVHRYLPQDIQLQFLFHRLPFAKVIQR